ncbi:MAG: hypothetical protein OQL09_06230 [Gammaproteobacteria bacterium]|nr:hypothetical protein [Gammaproteobacteria bacterium]
MTVKNNSSASISFDQYQKIISSIYDTALEPGKWKSVLAELSQILSAEQSNLRIINTDKNDVQQAYWHNKDPHWHNMYKDYYIHKDLWLHDILKPNKTFIARTHHLISNKDYEATEFHRDFVSPQNIHYGMGGKIILDDNLISFITLSRDRGRQGFEDDTHKTLLQFIPHIQKSLLIGRKTNNIELEKNTLLDAINQINQPLLLVTNNAEISFINSAAEQMIEQHPGISIKNQRICIQSPDTNRQLQKLIRQATDTTKHGPSKQGGTLTYGHSSTERPLSILISPVNPEMCNSSQPHEQALLFLSKQNPDTLPVELLTGLYNFTAAEARLTAQLCRGLTLDEISVKLCVTKNTLRTQLRSSFHKAGVSRQAELINLVNSGPAGIIKTHK